MRYYALAERPWVVDPDGGGSWGLPAGTIGAVDLAPIGGQSYVFLTSNQPYSPAAVAATFGDGAKLDAYLPSAQERSAWKSLIGTVVPGNATLLDILWSTLTDQADPEGATRALPIMPTHLGNLELHLGGHSLVRAERLPADPRGHPAWVNIQAVLQRTYRAIEGRDAVLARKWLGAQQRKLRLTPDAARDLLIPAGLPRELPLPPTTVIGDDFTDADNTQINAHTATGPNGGFSWTQVAGQAAFANIIGNQIDINQGDAILRAEADLSSDDHYAQYVALNAGGTILRGPAVRFAAAAETYYVGALLPATQARLYRVIAGVATELDRVTVANGVGTVVRTVADGSTISLLMDGASIISLTDTNVTGNLRTGFGDISNSGSNLKGDDFEAADLIAGGTTVTGTGAATLPTVTSSGIGEVDRTASGAISLPALVAAATGVLSRAGAGSAVLPAPTVTGTSEVTRAATAAVTLPGLVASGSGEITRITSGAVALPIPTTAGTGAVEHPASGAAILAALQAAGVAGVSGTTSATGSAVLPAAAASGAGLVGRASSGAIVAPALAASGTSEVVKISAGSATLPIPVAAAAGEVNRVSSGSATLPILLASGSVTRSAAIAGAIVLASIVVAGVGAIVRSIVSFRGGTMSRPTSTRDTAATSTRDTAATSTRDLTATSDYD